MNYAIRITPDSGAYTVICRDLPELNSVGYSVDEAFKEALDGIETVLMIYMEDRKPIPVPSAPDAGERVIHLPVSVVAKVALYNEMLSQRVSKAEMARRLGWHQAQVDRLLSLRHSTKLASIESAFEAIGKHLQIAVA